MATPPRLSGVPQPRELVSDMCGITLLRCYTSRVENGFTKPAVVTPVRCARAVQSILRKGRTSEPCEIHIPGWQDGRTQLEGWRHDVDSPRNAFARGLGQKTPRDVEYGRRCAQRSTPAVEAESEIESEQSSRLSSCQDLNDSCSESTSRARRLAASRGSAGQ